MKTYLESIGIDTSKAFHCLSPEHEDKNPSMRYDAKRNRIKCFSCGVNYDLFGLIKAQYSITDDKDVYAKMKELGAVRDDYFNKRGLSNATVDQYDLKVKDGYAVIPTGEKAFVSRNVDDDCKKGDRYRKSKGEAHLLLHADYSPSEPLFITEGEFDALSVIDIGHQAVALGGIGNRAKLFSLLDELKPEKPLILALDNDERGQEATDALEKELFTEGYQTLKFDLYEGYKDINEFLIADREGCIQAVNLKAEKANTLEVEEYKKNSAKAHIIDFLYGIQESVNTPAIKTQFDALDKVLDGGLYEGLYILGALSSLGKTTFLLQIADQIALQGYDVLFVSLEMARTELMAKSISRLTYQFCAGDGSMAKTARGITDGSRYYADESTGYGGYSDEEQTHITEMVQQYAVYADRLYFIEPTGGFTVDRFHNLIDTHKRITGKTPVVIVDYLQMLAPLDTHISEKQATDQNVLVLKQLSRKYKTPVIAISSLNRGSYTEAITMSSFKESGGIEYSSDILLALQPEGMGKDLDINEYKKDRQRHVELVILKNRSGRTGEKVTFRYTPQYNYFEGK